MIQTKVFRVDAAAPAEEILRRAAQAIRAGRLVVFPTETVYGVGADAFNEQAVSKIFAAKNRPATDPIIVHISDVAQLTNVAQDIPDIAWRLVERFWPGPLTLILKRHPNVPIKVSAGLETVAGRMPRHPVALRLIQLSGTSIAAPSANLFTRPSSTAVEHVLEDLDGRVDIILDAGIPEIGLESTVVDLTAPAPTVLRPGGTSVEALRTIVPQLIVSAKYVADDSAPAVSPGMMAKHYSPQARLMLFDGANQQAVLERICQTVRELQSAGQTVGIMTTEEDAPAFLGLPVRLVIMGTKLDLSTVGQNLFAKMRLLDAEQVDVILVKALNREGLGLAIWDRLARAAEGRVVIVES